MGWLGQSALQLAPALRSAQLVRSPHRLASGAVGTWRVPDVLCEGLHCEQTLYFLQGRLAQIEWLQLPSAEAGYAELLQSLRLQFGPELASSASTAQAIMETASWTHSGVDVLLFRSGRPEHPSVRLVIRPQHLVDAGEL